MLTDDRLTRELGDAFRDATAELTYSGRVPTPRRPGMLLVPATAVAVAAVAGFALTSGGTSPQPEPGPIAIQQPTSPDSTTSPGPVRPVRDVSRTLNLVGYSFTYRQASGDVPLYGEFVGSVPPDATAVQGSGSAKYYVGVDGTTGYQAGWVDAGNGTILEITSPDAQRAQLQAMFTAEPTQIPVVSGSGD